MDRMLMAFASIISVLSFSLVMIAGTILGYGLLTILMRGVIASVSSLLLFVCIGYFLLPNGQERD